VTREKYTRRRAVLATGSTLAAVGLSGCAGVLGGGADGEVTENEHEGDLEVLDHEIENARIGGTDSVRVNVTVTNTTDEAKTVDASAKFYDGDDVRIAETGLSGSRSVPDDQDVELHTSAPGRVADVARYELQLVNPWLG